MKAADHGLTMANTYMDLVSNLSMKEDYPEVFHKDWPGDHWKLLVGLWVTNDVFFLCLV